MEPYDKKPNDYDVPPLTDSEKMFLIDGINPEFIPIYEKIREKILLFGNIETRVTRNYINFRHPYKSWNYVTRQKEIKMGTLANVHFRKESIILAFNTRGKDTHDSHINLVPTKSFGVCRRYVEIKSIDELSGLEKIISQVIYYVSNEHRIVRINNKFINI